MCVCVVTPPFLFFGFVKEVVVVVLSYQVNGVGVGFD